MMKSFKYIKSLFLALVCALALTTSAICTDVATAQPSTVSTVSGTRLPDAQSVLPLNVVYSPDAYLNKTIVMNAKFDKFSTLGLDYKPAYKSSEDYISFLIKRDDTTFDIPLSEMKLFLKREAAEKFIDLKSGDEIQITGTVFSNALGDVWIDVTKLVLIKKAPDKKNGV